MLSKKVEHLVIQAALSATAVVNLQNCIQAADRTWGSSSSSGPPTWHSTGNWVGSAYPGSKSSSSNGDKAYFTTAGTAATIGMNFSSSNLGTPFYVGTYIITSGNRTFGSGGGTAGTVTLNGSTVNSVSNVIISQQSATQTSFNANVGSGTGPLAFSLSAGESVVDVTASATVTVNVALAQTSAGRSLKKTGAGTLSLTGATTYSGDTVVDAGTLSLNTGGSISSRAILLGASGRLNTNSGYTTANGQSIEGVGSITGNLSISSTSSSQRSALAPGENEVSGEAVRTGDAGNLRTSGSVTLSANADFVVDVGGPSPGVDFDVLTLNGTSKFFTAGNSRLVVNISAAASSVEIGKPYRIVDATGGTGNSVTASSFFANLPDNVVYAESSALRYKVTYGANYIDLTFDAVPEPGCMVSLAVVCGLIPRRRRR